jgi:hypothetical protein
MASIIKADNIQKVSDGTNIIKKCGSTITLGSCGATIALACGATQTGFGQTYSAVEYCTTAKTSPFTAAAGTGYFVNTTCGAVTVTLPASPTAGDVISFKDYAGQWNTNAVTLCNNGNKINGVCATASLSTQNQSVSLIYVDATKGWQDIQDSTSNVTGETYITATGGTVTTCGDYKVHTFTSDGCFAISGLATNPADNIADYLVVAGGGGGGGLGGGGAGGYRESKNPAAPWTASPLASATSLPVSVTTYPITVGGGGAGAPGVASGSPSIFSTITSTGGGKGAVGATPGPNSAGTGGSGGGGSYGSNTAGGAGNTPPTSPAQGSNGGSGFCGGAINESGGGGGGATQAGINAPSPRYGGAGAGTGINPSCTVGTPGPTPGLRYFSGGGGGAHESTTPGGLGGVGGGGIGALAGFPAAPPALRAGGPGTINTGGGGGGQATYTTGGAGGSGIVIIRYKYQ